MKKIIRFLKITISFLLLGYLATLVYVVSFSYEKNIPARADAIIVLGARLNLDNSPSEELYNRTMEAVQLYQSGKAEYFATTGGVGVGTLAESTVALKIAEKNGVSPEKAVQEKSSHTTLQNFEYLAPLLKNDRVHSVILVSDQYHIARAAMVAKHYGFAPVYWDYPKMTHYMSTLDIIFAYLREAAGIIVYAPKLAFMR